MVSSCLGLLGFVPTIQGKGFKMSVPKIYSVLSAVALGVAASALCAQSAHAETLTFTCGFTQAEIDLMNKANGIGGGYAMDPTTRFNFRIDMVARTAVALDYPNNKYPAAITPSQFNWSLPRDEDDPNAATFSFDRTTRALTSVDPEGNKTFWTCAER
jgi:hypothetical protein